VPDRKGCRLRSHGIKWNLFDFRPLFHLTPQPLRRREQLLCGFWKKPVNGDRPKAGRRACFQKISTGR